MSPHKTNPTARKPLHRMFTAVPPRYDLVNHVITLGLDSRWRRKAAGECLSSRPGKVLDLGCGTGDLIIAIARMSTDNAEMAGVDYSQPMLEIAERKAKRLAPAKKISFVSGDASSLPFPDGHFDCAGISFAFRNLTYKNPSAKRHLTEVCRVLRAEGRFVIVETSQPESRFIRTIYHLYLRWFVFWLGYLISGNKGAYNYLAESASRFYNSGEVKEMLISAGFREVSFRPLLFGAAGIHVATK